ncbi:hypothetical protein ES703_105632 [subsurface metagenome]
MEQSVVIYNQGRKILANFYLPYEGAPCIVMSHGLESSKDGDKWLVLSPQFYDAGFASLRFSYSGCGEGEEKSEGDFEDTTLTGRVSDYRAAIDFLYQTGIEATRLGVIGSSFGGMVALAARDDRIKAMVALATPYSIPLPSQEELGHIREKGYFELESGRRLGIDFYNDLCQYNILDEVGKIHCPLFIIHGSLDEVVPVENAYKLYSHANEPKRLEVIEGANHSLDNPGNLEKVISLSLEWFKTYL